MRQDQRVQGAERVVDTELDRARALLARLPVDRLPEPGPLPAGSRATVARAEPAVRRAVELRRVALGLKEGQAVVLAGTDGTGRSRLAGEFVRRFGRHFAGGVFWLDCSMPDEVPAQVAACGGAGAMDLRADFGELTLDERLHLVQEAWRGDMPRRLVLDDC